MSLVKAINEIQSQIDAFEKAIEIRENLIAELTRVNGHVVPSKVTKVKRVKLTKTGRKPLSKAARLRIAEAQRKRWAAQKKADKKAAK